MLRRATNSLVNLLNRWMPDSFAVAVVLSLLTFALAVLVAGYPPGETVNAWGDGIWNLLRFTNQVALTLLLGHAFAHTPPIQKLLLWLASRARSAAAAYMLVCFVSGIATLLSWGLGLITAGLMARATGEACARRGIVIHYPLLIASAFSGFVLFHQGLSGTIPLTVATPDHFLQDQLGLIPFSQTVFAPWSMAIVLAVLLSLPVVMARLRPEDSACEQIPAHLLDEPAEPKPPADPEVHGASTPAGKIERWRPLNLLVVAAGLYYLGTHFIERDQGLNLNILNFSFLLIGLGMARSPVHFVELIANAARVIGPILLQYPFYAGIAAMMATSGLAQMLVDVFVSLSSAQTLPFAAFFSAAILNIFIPTGGGQWAVQGPIMMEAAAQVGADLRLTAMTVALGDQWTNLIQPLVMIPVLAIAGLHIRQVMGYMVIALGWTGLIFVSGLALKVYL